MATWQPNTGAVEAVQQYSGLFKMPRDYFLGLVRVALQSSGALSEIDRLTALLAMKDETIKTLRERVLKDTATTQDDYDSGYRAA